MRFSFASLVALNVSEFADLIVINKKDLVPVSASEMQNKYFQESVKSTLGEPLFKRQVLILTSDGKRARLSTLSCEITSFGKGYLCGSTADHNYSIK
ncbi:hypothetical protein CK590_04745 [Campylobacter jejuni]|nr:hypothetical protein [Campylobacter jejuni]